MECCNHGSLYAFLWQGTNDLAYSGFSSSNKKKSLVVFAAAGHERKALEDESGAKWMDEKETDRQMRKREREKERKKERKKEKDTKTDVLV